MDMKKMMKQAQKMQREAALAQEEIAQMEFEATAGGGMVKATAGGDMTLKSVSPRTSRCLRTWSSPRSTKLCVPRPRRRMPA